MLCIERIIIHGGTKKIIRALFLFFLHNGWSVNLRAIENWIFGIRSIERKMRSILRTVCVLYYTGRPVRLEWADESSIGS